MTKYNPYGYTPKQHAHYGILNVTIAKLFTYETWRLFLLL